MENGVENFGAPRVDLHETTSIFRQVVVARVSRRLGVAGTRAVVGRRYFEVVADVHKNGLRLRSRVKNLAKGVEVCVRADDLLLELLENLVASGLLRGDEVGAG